MGRTADFFSRRHFRKSKFVLMSKASVKKEVKSSSHSGGHSREKPVSRAPVSSWTPKRLFAEHRPAACLLEAACPGPGVCPTKPLPDCCWQDSAQGRALGLLPQP